MADVLTLSENAATLAKQIGDNLKIQGSTAELKSMGSRISETAAALQQEVQRRRATRKTPAMNTLIAQKKAETRRAMESAAALPSKGIFGRAMSALRGTKQEEQSEKQEKSMSIANAFKNQPLFANLGGVKKGGARRHTHRRKH